MKYAVRLFFLLIFILAASLIYASGTGPADEEEIPGDGVKLSRIVLYSSGLGYFEHLGTVAGEDTLDLAFKTKDINDLLKSLVLQDFDGGQVSSVNYSSREPLATVLRSLAIDLSGNPGISAILQQVRGRQVQIKSKGGGVPVTGTIIGVESKENRDGRLVPFLNVRAKRGITGIEVENLGTVDFTDPVVSDELGIALDLLAQGDQGDEKRISIRFSGEGTRRVRVGYLIEMPVWKTSYRLVLGENDEHYLQGWAIVENTTETDWGDVDLSLVSGQPVSFTMDLYRPIYITRPAVSPDVQAAIGPKVSEKAATPSPLMSRSRIDSAPQAQVMGSDAFSGFAEVRDEDFLGSGGGVESAASGQRSGEFFQYSIELPVTIPRKESAMVPIVSESVNGERLSLFNINSHPIHPFNSVRIANDTGLDLKGGPVSLFEAGAYAGDGILNSLVTGSEALLSYSLDLGTEISVQTVRADPEVIGVQIRAGYLELDRLYRSTTSYSIRRRNADPGKILIEHPILVGWDLIKPSEPIEQTRSYYRFEHRADSDPQPEQTLEVVEEMNSQERSSLERMSNSQINAFIRDVDVSARIENGLLGIVDRRETIDDVVRERQQVELRRSTIYRDQERIRQNMEQLDRDSTLYKRYAEQLQSQEDELDAITSDLASLTAREKRLRDELADYMANLQAS